MKKTSEFSVDDVGGPEAITATIHCTELTVWPKDGLSEWYFRSPRLANVDVKVAAGQPMTIRPHGLFQGLDGELVLGCFDPGRTVGYGSALSGTVEMWKMEEY